MIWAQAGVSFLIWIGLGVLLRVRNGDLRIRLAGMSRTSRTALGSIGLIAALGILLGGVVMIANLGGMQKDRLTIFGWLAMTVLGLIFVGLQVLGAAAMISLLQREETVPRSDASLPKGGNNNHD